MDAGHVNRRVQTAGVVRRKYGRAMIGDLAG